MESNETINKISKKIIDRKAKCREFYNADITEKVITGDSSWRLI